jgi:hypothetical protein
MFIPDHPTLIRTMLQARLKQLHTTCPILAATFNTVQRRCGKASCRCSRGGPRHPTQQVTFPRHGKTASVYVPKELASEVQAWIAEHHRIKRLLQEISQLSLALIRLHVTHRCRRQGRP